MMGSPDLCLFSSEVQTSSTGKEGEQEKATSHGISANVFIPFQLRGHILQVKDRHLQT